MTAERNEVDRHLVPRWRSVADTVAAGEFQRRPQQIDLSSSLERQLAEARHRWHSEQSAVAAAELIGAALAVGEDANEAGALDLLERQENRLQRALALRAGSGYPARREEAWLAQSVSDTGPLIARFRRNVASAKLRVARDCFNTIAWADLARAYTTLGETGKALRAISVARGLAPTSRYLLRAEARLLVHVGEPDQALKSLAASPRTLEDPWLMAASLSVAASGGLPVKGARAARRILERGGFRSIELSDLQSELATLEFAAGGRRARRMFERSLESPTDNSLAQAEWASRRVPMFEVSVDSFDVPFRSEALSLAAAQTGQWADALRHALDWLADQPFDLQAAVHASYIAATGLDDWATARHAAELGVSANPNDPTIINNLAYALTELGELELAASWLERLPHDESRVERVALDATRGLLLMRSGQPERGAALYRRAIDRAREQGEREAETIARAMLLREEIRLGAAPSPIDLKALQELSSGSRDAGARRAADNSLRLAEARR